MQIEIYFIKCLLCDYMLHAGFGRLSVDKYRQPALYCIVA